MLRDGEVPLSFQVALHGLQCAVRHFFDKPAAGTDQVVVMASRAERVADLIIGLRKRLGQAAFHEQVEGAVDGGEAHARLDPAQCGVESLRRDMPALRHQNGDNSQSLGCGAMPRGLKPPRGVVQRLPGHTSVRHGDNRSLLRIVISIGGAVRVCQGRPRTSVDHLLA